MLGLRHFNENGDEPSRSFGKTGCERCAIRSAQPLSSATLFKAGARMLASSFRT